MSYSYGEIERAMREVMAVQEEDVPAFKSKIRHFRTLNIPAVDQPGSGARTIYEQSHALELAIGLSLADFGVPPRWLRGLVTHSVRALSMSMKASDDVFTLLGPQGSVGATVYGRENLAKYTLDPNVVAPFAVLNLSHIANLVRKALG